MTDEPDGLMVFDGACRFCSTGVDIALALDPKGAIRFTPIQSNYGRALAEAAGLDAANPETFIFFDRGVALQKSEAVLAFAGRLPAPWRWLRVFRLVPRSIRDPAYLFIARNRYRIFGRRTVCRLPGPTELERFITEPPEGASGAP